MTRSMTTGASLSRVGVAPPSRNQNGFAAEIGFTCAKAARFTSRQSAVDSFISRARLNASRRPATPKRPAKLRQFHVPLGARQSQFAELFDNVGGHVVGVHSSSFHKGKDDLFGHADRIAHTE
jgi:hypothetical protein